MISILLVLSWVGAASAFSSTPLTRTQQQHHRQQQQNVVALNMGLLDGFLGQGSGKDRLDEQWEAQQEILRNRRKPREERDQYFRKIEDQRAEASKKQRDMWSWQTKKYKKGEDPIDEWRKQRAAGTISDLDEQYGDEKKIGGIPLPMASFGVGGEFGVG